MNTAEELVEQDNIYQFQNQLFQTIGLINKFRVELLFN